MTITVQNTGSNITLQTIDTKWFLPRCGYFIVYFTIARYIFNDHGLGSLSHRDYHGDKNSKSGAIMELYIIAELRLHFFLLGILDDEVCGLQTNTQG